MNIYDLFMSPLEMTILKRLRKEMVTKAKGDVLEIGVGTGVNFGLYNYDNIDSSTGLDVQISSKARERQKRCQTLVEGVAENLPFHDNSFNTVVVTLVLCSVQDSKKALNEIHRVLKPQGKLIFIEHILSDKNIIGRIFHKVDKRWNKITNCTLCSQTDELIRKSPLEVKYIKKKALGIFCYGIAEKA